MLEGLDDIRWHELTHAYGEASDVPALIRDLVSSDQSRREAAYAALFANICHQGGTIYEATVHALPFLIDLLAAPETPNRDWLVTLVASIINGHGGWLARVAARPIINPFTRQPLPLPADIDTKIAEERVIVAEVRRRGMRAMPLLQSFLQHRDPDVRELVAKAVAALAAARSN